MATLAITYAACVSRGSWTSCRGHTHRLEPPWVHWPPYWSYACWPCLLADKKQKPSPCCCPRSISPELWAFVRSLVQYGLDVSGCFAQLDFSCSSCLFPGGRGSDPGRRYQVRCSRRTAQCPGYRVFLFPAGVSETISNISIKQSSPAVGPT